MPVTSAGLLAYRFSDDQVLEVMLVHPGGPFWARRDDGAWSVPKGEYLPGEDPALAAVREFEEETGQRPPPGELEDLGEVRQSGGKIVRVFAAKGDVELGELHSNEFELEWPPRSGRRMLFPEVDRAEWMTVARAEVKLLESQRPFLRRLVARLRESGYAGFALGD